MGILEIVEIAISAVLAAACFVIAYRQAKEKGTIFNNRYSFASKEEREKMDRKLEYKIARNCFFILGVIFILLALTSFWKWMLWPFMLVTAVLLVYAIAAECKNPPYRSKELRNRK